MNRTIVWISVLGLALSLTLTGGCSRDDAEDAAKKMGDAAEGAGNAAGNLAEQAGNLANQAGGAAGNMAADAEQAMGDMANRAGDAARDAAGAVAGNAVEACRAFAEQGAWGQALEVCKKAHEMLPDDLALEHAYQQAQAASN